MLDSRRRSRNSQQQTPSAVRRNPHRVFPLLKYFGAFVTFIAASYIANFIIRRMYFSLLTSRKYSGKTDNIGEKTKPGKDGRWEAVGTTINIRHRAARKRPPVQIYGLLLRSLNKLISQNNCKYNIVLCGASKRNSYGRRNPLAAHERNNDRILTTSVYFAYFQISPIPRNIPNVGFLVVTVPRVGILK